MSNQYQTPRGTADILPGDQPYWDWIRDSARETGRRFGYRRIDTPVFESTSVFVRTVGPGTDIVEKEMYTFQDRGEDLLTLRPEGTAPVGRAYIQHGMHALPQPVRLFYLAPIFRYERPQAGRYRQHWQFGAEAIGDENPEVDAEVIHLLWSFLESLGLRDLSLRLNSIGDAACRPAYLVSLRDHYETHLSEVCDDCRVRFEKNPLRLLDCKQDRCQPLISSAPEIAGLLCVACAAHFDRVREIIELWDIPYEISPRLVRGLDYYTRTVFEVHPAGVGSQTALGAGGRYDGLIEQLGGRPTPGVGFGSGIERMVLNLKSAGIQPPGDPRSDVFIVYLGEAANRKALELAANLRSQGLSVQLPTGKRSLRAQFRAADASGARHAIVLGDDELAQNVATVRDLASGEQQSVGLDEIGAMLRRIRSD
ncbi:MAG: histidine--tRNA ligase [Chloroflexi bacterium]|nr:histidine--tRNA ligase [Chloroflexota bacterium]